MESHKPMYISECLDNSDCRDTEVCTNSTNGRCIDPCESFGSRCNEDEMCLVTNHNQTCTGNTLKIRF